MRREKRLKSRHRFQHYVGVVDFQHVMSNLIVLLSILTVSSVVFFCCVFDSVDGDFLEFTSGRPLPLTDRAKAVFHMSILNDTLFLSIINVLDYSILVGIDEEKMELVVGIIDFMRQYDILKQMERVGKSLPMVVGSEAPTIIQPPLYKARFTNAMERYFMTVPSKWTTI